MEIREKTWTEDLKILNKYADTPETEKEAKFRKLLEVAPGAILVLNQNQQIVIANNQFEEMFGYECSEVIGKNIDMLVPSRFSHHHEHVEKFILHPQKKTHGPWERFFCSPKGWK
jgi:PAS domain S-box-containing protein